MTHQLNIYAVSYHIRGAGGYVPEDPVTSGGGYYADKHGTVFITCASAALAKKALLAVWPSATGLKAKLISKAS